MPFALNEATRFISPTKTLEYMAAGKPIVSTGITDVKSMFSDVVRIADDAAGFIEGCRAALHEKSHARNDRLADMQACVWRYSWGETVLAVRRAIEALLAQRVAPTAASGAVVDTGSHAVRPPTRLLPSALASTGSARASMRTATGSIGLPPEDDLKVASAGG